MATEMIASTNTIHSTNNNPSINNNHGTNTNHSTNTLPRLVFWQGKYVTPQDMVQVRIDGFT